MNFELNRSLSVFADSHPVTGFRHARLTGTDSVGLQPMPFTLRLWNLAESDYHLLQAAKTLSVRHGGSVLAAGGISDVYRRRVPEGAVTEAVFSAGLPLWEAPVSLSVEAGVSVSETLRRILEASGTGIPLLAFPGNDPVRTRGQAFHGRAAECVGEALSAAGARGYLTEAGLCVVPVEGPPVSMNLTEADLAGAPVRAGKNLLVLRTGPVGWPLGKQVSVKWPDGYAEGLVTERSVDADNMEGNWQAEVIVELKTE